MSAMFAGRGGKVVDATTGPTTLLSQTNVLDKHPSLADGRGGQARSGPGKAGRNLVPSFENTYGRDLGEITSKSCRARRTAAEHAPARPAARSAVRPRGPPLFRRTRPGVPSLSTAL